MGEEVQGGFDGLETEPWRYRCPFCGSTSLRRRVLKGGYRCKNCGDIFDEPIDANYI